MHQATRVTDEAGKVVATLDDHEVVRDLVGPTRAAGVAQSVTKATRETVDAVAVLAGKEGVTARRVGALAALAAARTGRVVFGGVSTGVIRSLAQHRCGHAVRFDRPLVRRLAARQITCSLCKPPFGKLLKAQDRRTASGSDQQCDWCLADENVFYAQGRVLQSRLSR